MDKLVAIIVTNYNGMEAFFKGKTIIELVLGTLRKTRYPRFKVVFGDASSTDNSVAYIRKNFPEVDIVITKKKLNFSVNNNNATKYAMKKYNPDYFLFLNNDIIITDRDWLAKMVKVAEKDKRVGMEGCKLLYPSKRVQHAGMELGSAPRNIGRGDIDTAEYSGIREMDGVTGACLLVKRDVVRKIGLLDENLYMGFEDVDYCIRAKHAGFKILYNGNVSLVHLEGHTSTNNAVDPKLREKLFYYRQRNYAYFAFKHFADVRLAQTLLLQPLSAIISIESKDKKRGLGSVSVKDRAMWRLGVSIRALKDGKQLYDRVSGRANRLSRR